ncbi:hypothetical protein RRG08_033189 [Elysia crispata]|uniref:Uncharacterized protein n=1 Tax=Elysia crispata TaxID=231223 RepID=A0AAE1EDC2_9GAST|nr:hypothetical protein RRG08_033189 [Elysia crispata]
MTGEVSESHASCSRNQLNHRVELKSSSCVEGTSEQIEFSVRWARICDSKFPQQVSSELPNITGSPLSLSESVLFGFGSVSALFPDGITSVGRPGGASGQVMNNSD